MEKTNLLTGRSFSACGIYITAMVIYSTIGIFRRFIPLSSGALAFARGLIGGGFLLLWVAVTGKSLKLNISRKKLALLCLTGVALGANWMLVFEADNYTTVAVATLCYYMEPTILILLSPWLFQERLTPVKGVCAAVSLVGMVLVCGIGKTAVPDASHWKGILLGLGAAALYTTVVILNKKNPVENAYGKTVVQLFTSAAVLLPYLFLTEDLSAVTLDGPGLWMLLLVGVVHTGVAYAMYFGSIQRLPSQTVAVFSYIDPVLAVILSALILKENISAGEILGAVLIIGAAVISETVGTKKEK